MKRCAIYIRVSTVEQAIDGWSLEAQKMALTKEATKRGYRIVDYYVDEGKSARKRLKSRKEIKRLLEDVKDGLIDVILFKDITRWFRSVADFYQVQQILDDRHVSWVAAEQPQLTMETPDGRLQVNVLLSVGQNEADQTSERIKYVNTYLRSEKRWTSGAQNLPRGFTVDDEQHVIIDPESEAYVRELISEAMRTSSARSALIHVNSIYPEMTMYYGNALSLLKNEMLCGDYRGIEGFCEAYISRLEFDALQSRLSRNARVNRHHTYIFSGLLICADCGRNLTGNTCSGPKRAHPYKSYRCNGSRIQKSCPNSTSVGEAKLERMLFKYVEQAVEGKLVEVRTIKEARASKPRPKNNDAQIDAALARLDDLYLDPFTEHPMSREEYEKRHAAIEAKRIKTEAQEELPDVKDLEAIRDLMQGNIRDVYDTFSEMERREFWRSIIKSITLKSYDIKSIVFVCE